MSNRLASEMSPFLLAHKDNPIAWRLYGEEAFEEARASGKPVLLSIGFSACHWCHVMNRESFSDPELAALIDEHFIPVLVDRFQRPDVDQLYQACANLMGSNGGWPLTAFLTEKGEPFIIGGYVPKEEQYGQPALGRVLQDVINTYHNQRHAVDTTAQRMRDGLTQLWATERRAPINNAVLDAAAVKIGQRYDVFYGGITGEPKFPAPNLLEFMWRSYLRTGLEQFSQIVHATLHNICMGGIYDHLGGGFHRYSNDERWSAPNFEKMLYDNAQLVDVLLTVTQHNRWPLFTDRIHETITFLLRDLRVGDAFAACIEADSDGEAGKYYLWSEAEIDAALKGTFASRFKEVYNVTRDGTINGKNVLHRMGKVAGYPIGEADETLFHRQRTLLLAARAKRTAPFRDEQILADWNGIAIAALARAGATFKQPDWLAAAATAFEFVCTAMGDGDRLFHAWLGGKRTKESFADDYAQMIRAALALFDATQDRHYVERAAGWVRFLNAHFWDEIHGGYCTNAGDGQTLFMRPRMIFDQFAPSANGTMVGELTKLFLITNDTAYRDRLNGILVAFSGEMHRAPLSMPSYMSGFETALASLQIVIVGSPASAKTKALIDAVRSRSLPAYALVVVESGAALPEGHAARAATQANGEPSAYICQNGMITAPITNPVQLAQQLLLPAQLAAAARAQAEAAAKANPQPQGRIN